MGYRVFTLKLPTDYTDDQLRKHLEKELKITKYIYQIEKKSLDARKKDDIHWLIRVSVVSDQINGDTLSGFPVLNIPYRKRCKKVVVVGSGPAGFFSAFVLQKAGFQTTLIERGSEVKKRAEGIRTFENTGIFNPISNYAFGEGGAGTFSDGKLTSRTKSISREKQFIVSSYIQAGAPEEIAYLSHPHLGSDNLRRIVRNLRKEFLNIGGTVHFETFLEDFNARGGIVAEAVTSSGGFNGDYFVIAPGHSAYETYRMLIKRGVFFHLKNFAIGSRVEHSQKLINQAQWGCNSLPGVKAAEYRMASKGDGLLPVYTFCMCPGGTVIPATAYERSNIVNGMSRYKRSGKFANAACVAGVDACALTEKITTPLEALNWLERLEQNFYHHAGGYQAPFCKIIDFINRKEPSEIPDSSYPLGLKPAALWQLLPRRVSESMREGLKDFGRKIKGYESGIIMGLESKTSSPIQVVRDKNGLCSGFENLYLVGEGSGFAGGIISSGADGIKAAMNIIERDCC